MVVPHQFLRGKERKKVYYNTLVKAGDRPQEERSSLSKADGCSIYHLSPKSPQSPGAWQDAPMVPYKYVYVYIDFFKGRREERVGTDTLPLTLPWAQKLGEGGKGFLHF